MLQKPLLLNYISPECRDIAIRTGEIICTSEGGTLDGFDIVTDDSFLA